MKTSNIAKLQIGNTNIRLELLWQKYLDMLYKYVKTVESGNKWDNDKINENNNDSIVYNSDVQATNDWKKKELWENVVLQAFKVTNSKEFPDLWLHVLIDYCNINTRSIVKLSLFSLLFFFMCFENFYTSLFLILQKNDSLTNGIDNEFGFKHLSVNKQANMSYMAVDVCDSNDTRSIDWLHFILKHNQCNLNAEKTTAFQVAWGNRQWDKVGCFCLPLFLTHVQTNKKS